MTDAAEIDFPVRFDCYGEIVAAQPPNGAVTRLAEPFDDAFEQAVADRPAEQLIDRIEAPEVDGDDRQPFRRGGGGEAFAERLDEAKTAQRSGQRIVAGEIGEPRLLGASLGYVAKC